MRCRRSGQFGHMESTFLVPAPLNSGLARHSLRAVRRLTRLTESRTAHAAVVVSLLNSENESLRLLACEAPPAAREPFFSFFPLFLAKCLPSWPPSPEIRTARAKFTDFLTF